MAIGDHSCPLSIVGRHSPPPCTASFVRSRKEIKHCTGRRTIHTVAALHSHRSIEVVVVKMGCRGGGGDGRKPQDKDTGHRTRGKMHWLYISDRRVGHCSVGARNPESAITAPAGRAFERGTLMLLVLLFCYISRNVIQNYEWCPTLTGQAPCIMRHALCYAA